jgi:hypothetical protein
VTTTTAKSTIADETVQTALRGIVKTDDIDQQILQEQHLMSLCTDTTAESTLTDEVAPSTI